MGFGSQKDPGLFGRLMNVSTAASGNGDATRAIDTLKVLQDVIREFELTSLVPLLRSCEDLAGEDAPLDIAVLGQFKCGKSSLLNALLGTEIFPVGVLPATAVITRASPGQGLAIRVTHLDGSVEVIARERLADFATEKGNPHNCLQVAVVDVFTEMLCSRPGIRLVDTPGLGSVLVHNTKATQQWLPNVGVAMVAISAERPLADEDRKLLEFARQLYPRVVVVLTKVDLLSDAERQEVLEFLKKNLTPILGSGLQIIPFSVRVNREQWVNLIDTTVLQDIAANLTRERGHFLNHKLAHVTSTCRGYLEVALRAAQKEYQEKERLREAVIDECVSAPVIQDELRGAENTIRAGARAAFEEAFRGQEPKLIRKLVEGLNDDAKKWRGNLGARCRDYECWMVEHISKELTALATVAVPVAEQLISQAEVRLSRVVEAFRERISKNINASMGITIAPADWEAIMPQVTVVPVHITKALMINWELAGWILPMRLFGGLFRSHVVKRVPWEVEENIARLVSDWVGAVHDAIANLRNQASDWLAQELDMLHRLLGKNSSASPGLRLALTRFDQTWAKSSVEGKQP